MERPKAERRTLCVADRLDDLKGPTTGIVTLPERLDWSPYPSHDLSEPNQLHALYETVLRKAASARDLTGYINRDLLVREWDNLDIPGSVRKAWEEVHPKLRRTDQGPSEPDRYYMNGGWMDDEYDSFAEARAAQVDRMLFGFIPNDLKYLDLRARRLRARADKHPQNLRLQARAANAEAAVERCREALHARRH